MKRDFKKLIGISSLIFLCNAPLAFAGTETCNVVITSCTTNALKANASGHWIKWGVENGPLCDSKYRIYDVANNVTVASGYIGTGKSRWGTVEGLYGSYKLEVTNSCFDTIGYIDN